MLKVFAGVYITEQDNLSSKEKLQLLKFVKEANEDQIKYLLLNGNIKYNLTEDDKRFISEHSMDFVNRLPGVSDPDIELPPLPPNKRNNILPPPKRVQITPNKSPGQRATDNFLDKLNSPIYYVKGALLAIFLIASAYKIYQNYFSKAAQACKGKSGSEKDKCMKDFRNKAVVKQIQFLESGKSKCNKSNDPNGCRKKVQEKITKLKFKLK